MLKKQTIVAGLLSLMGFWTFPARAELTIEITKGIESAVPIAIVPFGWNGLASQLPVDISEIVNSDLSRSGYFKTLPERDMLTRPTSAEMVKFRNWQVLGQEYLVIGHIRQDRGQYQIQFQLFDVFRGEQLTGYRISSAPNDLRITAHRISDIIYEKLTGTKGVFGTRIAYITGETLANGRKEYKLQVADADGFNPKTIISSVEPLMSPAWSPDGKKIAYVSFEKKSSAIYIQTLATGERVRISGFPGINGAPSWSPDGARLAMTLSKDGSPDIYVLNLAARSLMKLTESYAIDTEPTWSPDGRNIVFTSDRGGKPQLYIMPSHGGRATRLTFDGDYNARGVFSPDGKKLAMVHANRGDYRIAVMDMATRSVSVLTKGRLDEAPSFAPNGSMILYSSRSGGRSTLAAVSADGGVHQNLAVDRGDVREPAWSPL
ncbi:MAG: Tol-Pal system beta propeller repeat protein TolB [Gammaproteobacteria bacterium]